MFISLVQMIEYFPVFRKINETIGSSSRGGVYAHHLPIKLMKKAETKGFCYTDSFHKRMFYITEKGYPLSE